MSCALLGALLLVASSSVHSEQWSHRTASHGATEMARGLADGQPALSRHDDRSCALCLGLAQGRTAVAHPICLRSVPTAQATLTLRAGNPDPLPKSPVLAILRSRGPPVSA